MVHLVAASLPVFNVWWSHLSLSHEVCLWSVSVQEDSVDSCDPPDVEEATAFPSEEDDEIREWRQEFPEQPRRAISRIHTNLGHPQNSTLATMISDAGGSEEIIKSATVPLFCAQANVSASAPASSVSSKDSTVQ